MSLEVEVLMIVRLVVHSEESNGDVLWWSETDAVAGFSAAADSYEDLVERSSEALRAVFAEDGQSLERIDVELGAGSAAAG